MDRDEGILQYSCISKAGDRTVNEDCIQCCILKDRACFVLADGLGGHGQGDIASRFVTAEIIKDFKESNSANFLKQSVVKSHLNLLAYQEQKHCIDGMKTTIVVLLIIQDRIQWIHVGDSRLYFWSKGRIIERTLDHSVPQMLVRAGELKEKNIRFHEDRNRLLRAIGEKTECLEPEISRIFKTNKCQAFLLCSDGFWEFINEKEMRLAYSKSKTPKEWLEQMEDIICKHGKNKDMDNYSAIAVWI